MPARLAVFEHDASDAARLRAMLSRPSSASARGEALAQPASAAPVRAWVEDAEARLSSTFEGAAACPRVMWEGAGGSGSRDVPAKVARAFGAEPRDFGSVGELESRLDALLRAGAWERLQALVKARERSAADVRSRLEVSGYPRDVACESVARAERCQLVDDARYATSFARAKARAGWGRQRILRELAGNGVADDVALKAVDASAPGGDERARARAVVARRRVPETNPVPKLARFLVGRGFASDVAFSVAKSYVQDVNGL